MGEACQLEATGQHDSPHSDTILVLIFRPSYILTMYFFDNYVNVSSHFLHVLPSKIRPTISSKIVFMHFMSL